MRYREFLASARGRFADGSRMGSVAVSWWRLDWAGSCFLHRLILSRSGRNDRSHIPQRGLGWSEALMQDNQSAKNCTTCKIDKPIGQFYRHARYKDGRKSQCKDCQRKSDKTGLERRARWGKKCRMRALEHYGGSPPRCHCCGEHRIEFMEIDHLNDNGAQHRRELNRPGGIDEWLAINGLPDGYCVLCSNCNISFGRHGYCPHERDGTGRGRPKTTQQNTGEQGSPIGASNALH